MMTTSYDIITLTSSDVNTAFMICVRAALLVVCITDVGRLIRHRLYTVFTVFNNADSCTSQSDLVHADNNTYTIIQICNVHALSICNCTDSSLSSKQSQTVMMTVSTIDRDGASGSGTVASRWPYNINFYFMNTIATQRTCIESSAASASFTILV